MPEIPKGVKTPQDRKPKKVEEDLLGSSDFEIELHGIKLVIPADATDDFELLDDLSRLDNGDASRLPSLLRRLLPDIEDENGDTINQWSRAMDSIRDQNGRVTIESGATFVQEIFEAINPNS